MKKFLLGSLLGYVVGTVAGIIVYDKSLKEDLNDGKCSCVKNAKSDGCTHSCGNDPDFVQEDYSLDTYKRFESQMGLYPGAKIKHFKRDLFPYKDDDKKYLYIYDGLAVSTEDGETKLCIYHEDKDFGKTWVRPALEFFGDVDEKKYPELKGKKRFEVVRA